MHEATTASNTSVTTNNIFNINNNNNNTSNDISNSNNNNNHSNEKENEVNNFLDTLDNFEFDINLLTENSSKDKETALEVKEEDQQLLQPSYYNHRQQQLTEVDDDKHLKQHQLELQTMLDEILFNNKNNNNNNYNKINNNNTTSNNNNNNNINDNIMAANIGENEELFMVAPNLETNDFFSQDDIEISNFGTTQFNSEEAVDLNNIGFSLQECFINSQPTDIMFSSGYSQSSSQNIINEISRAEPHILPNYSATATTSGIAPIQMDECDFNDQLETFYTPQYFDESSIIDCKEMKPFNINPLKRPSSQTSQLILKKQKLSLNTQLCRENVLPQQSEINTPSVIDIIDQVIIWEFNVTKILVTKYKKILEKY